MARWSRRRGPSALFAIPAAFTAIPGLSVTRRFDDGELLLSYRFVVDNISGGVRSISGGLDIDGVEPTPIRPTFEINTNRQVAFGETILFPVAAGVHTIIVGVLVNIIANVNVVADSGQLTVVQLPLWDGTDDIL